MHRVRGAIRSGAICLFAVSGVAHLVRPRLFYPLMPKQLPAHDLLIYASGAAELACSVGLRTGQKWAPRASATLLLAVWPGNLEYALRVTRTRGPRSRAAVVGWARMPLQIPLIWAVLADQSRVGDVCAPRGVGERGGTDKIISSAP
mgnify:FL=1